MTEITIAAGETALRAQLNDSPTAEKIVAALPLEGKAVLWGAEIYFPIPVEAEEEPDARQEVEVGQLAYWPVGKAFCIFFGPTPVSDGEEPRAYSPVNVFGKISGDPAPLKSIPAGTLIRVSAADSG